MLVSNPRLGQWQCEPFGPMGVAAVVTNRVAVPQLSLFLRSGCTCWGCEGTLQIINLVGIAWSCL